MVGFLHEMSASPEPLWPMIAMSSLKSMEYISASCPVPEMVFMMLMAIATLMSPSTAHAVPCLISMENAGISIPSRIPALPWANPS